MSNDTRTPSHDRRGASRPLNGDRRNCASCGSITRFEERYAVARHGITAREPAWVCRRCGAETFVRVRAPTRAPLERSPRGRATAGETRRRELRELRRTLADVRALARAQRQSAGTMRKRMRAVLKQAAAAQFISVLAADPDGRLLEANAAACALTGLSRHELLNRRLVDLFTDHPERFDRAWRRFLESGEFSGACRLRKGSGQLITVECVASANLIPGVHVGTLASRRMLRSLT